MANGWWTRRDLIRVGMAGSATVLLPAALGGCGGSSSSSADGQVSLSGQGAPAEAAWGTGWQSDGVANLKARRTHKLLQSGSNVFPHDPRAIAFISDRRFRNGDVRARFVATGAGGGVILRRTAPFTFYAAVYDGVLQTLTLLRKTGRRFGDAGTRTEDLLDTLTDESEQILAVSPALNLDGPVTIRFSARSDGGRGTRLKAFLRTSAGLQFTVSAVDNTPELQGAGDAGVLATAVTGLVGNPAVPALPSLGALFVTDLGAQLEASPVGALRAELVSALSTAEIADFAIETDETAQVTVPSVDIATTGRPLDGGMRLSVVTDVPAEVTVELARDAEFREAERIDGGRTNGYNTCFVDATSLVPDQVYFWRARVSRQGRESVGPVRRFRTLPGPDRPLSPVTVAVGSCATEFNQVFSDIANEQPDLFIWEGDLDYPDSVGPVAQTVSGFSGIWKDFLWAPQLRPILDCAGFVPQRDDHDYGRNDIDGSKDIPERGIVPYEHIMNPDTFFRFDAGSMGIWVLDSRRFTDSIAEPNTPDKSLIGLLQREWLLETLAMSDAPFKIICSPMPFFYSTNNDRG